MDPWRIEEERTSLPTPRWEELVAEARDLTAVILDLNHLIHRSNPWQTAGVLPSDALPELSKAGQITTPVAALIEARPVWQEGRMRVWVRGHCRADMVMTCVRCLADFPLDLTASIQAYYAVGADPAIQSRQWHIEEDLEFLTDGVLKIRHLVEEELLLALPMHPVCVSGCAGLCSACGADLNRNPCGCRVQASGSPFAVLKNWQFS
ncbi:MAG: DUF177 domain-containing protein [Magnetococcales bacterium]|nr:DUF177 domain-containing protein [Magnetococcales bacterium]NGZ04936.1 DUF177 domain-containing protein [Magnetococcales bacterium]